MADFKSAHEFTARWEGGLVDHKADPGGITKYGISLRWLRSEGLEIGDIDLDGDMDADDIRALTFDQASALYQQKFWNAYRLGDLPQLMATIHYDCTVNTGPRQAALIAQRACNDFVGVYGCKLTVDGVFGPKTREFLTKYANPTLAHALVRQREGFYRRLVAQNNDMTVFFQGWMNRCRDLRRFVGLEQA